MSDPVVRCRLTTRSMWDYIDGRLSDTRGELLRRHVAECARCRGILEFHQRVRGLLLTLCNDSPEVPALRDRVIAALRGDAIAGRE